MTPLDRLKRASIAIMRHDKFCAFSGVVAYCKVELTDGIRTACTDGRTIMYNPSFVDSLTDPELRFLVMHEATHVAYRHLTTWRALWDKNPKLTNIAADHFVNLALVDTDNGGGFVTMPKIGIQPEPRFRGKSVQEIFNILLNEQNSQDQDSQDSQDGEGKGKGSGEGIDEHDFEGASQQTAEESKQQAEEIQRALRQGEIVAKRRGQGKGASSALIGDLLAPKLDWRQLLRDFVQETCAGRDESTWSRPNRRYIGNDIYMPSMQSTTMGELAVVIDTSGSCFSGSVITSFVSELASIIESVRPERVRVLYCDAAVHGEQVFDDGQFSVTQLKVKGGGGTDLTTAFEYIRTKRYQPQAAIVFTDGETPYGTAPGYPVLWAMTGSITAPYGTTIKLD